VLIAQNKIGASHSLSRGTSANSQATGVLYPLPMIFPPQFGQVLIVTESMIKAIYMGDEMDNVVLVEMEICGL
jgi:hypothetical protein